MRAAVVKIGNSQGVRIPKVLLEEAGLSGQVELRAEAGRIIIECVKHPREGWEEAFKNADVDESGELLLGDFPNEFDKEEWNW
jgi:antitoxin MazE